MKFQLYLFFIVAILFVSSGYSQSVDERQKAIATLESLTYEKIPFSDGGYNKLVFEYFELDERMEITAILFMNSDRHIEHKHVFYLEDLDLNSLTYNFIEWQPGSFLVEARINAKQNSIEKIVSETNLGQNPFPLDESEFLDVMRIVPIKSLSKGLAEKFIKNVQIALGAKKAIYVDYKD